jgi:hypothetical protein
VSYERNTSGRDPNKLGIISANTGIKHYGVHKKEGGGVCVRHYSDVRIAVAENVVYQRGGVTGARRQREGKPWKRVSFGAVKHFEVAHKTLKKKDKYIIIASC